MDGCRRVKRIGYKGGNSMHWLLVESDCLDLSLKV
jgi:hypothetical protein